MKIKIGIVGCRRGKELVEISKKTNLEFDIIGAYDKDGKKFAKLGKKIKTYNNLNSLLKNKEIEAVYIASPVKFHAHQTISALKNKKHVLCEVPAFQKINDGKKILNILKKKKYVYMMAENYCFLPQHLALNNLIKKKSFGEITFIRTSYIHDCRSLGFNKKNGNLTWRGKERRKLSGNDYPTHSIGPICKFLDTDNKGDCLKNITTFSNKEEAMSKMYFKIFPKFKNIKNNFKRHDTSLSIIRTKNNKIIELICDTTSSRPNSMVDLYIQGTKMSYISGRYDGEDSIISSSNSVYKSKPYKKFNYKKYLRKKDKIMYHKLGKKFSFYKILENFQNAIQKKVNKPYIDFNDAYLWSSIIELSKISLIKNSKNIKLKYINKKFK